MKVKLGYLNNVPECVAPDYNEGDPGIKSPEAEQKLYLKTENSSIENTFYIFDNEESFAGFSLGITISEETTNEQIINNRVKIKNKFGFFPS